MAEVHQHLQPPLELRPRRRDIAELLHRPPTLFVAAAEAAYDDLPDTLCRRSRPAGGDSGIVPAPSQRSHYSSLSAIASSMSAQSATVIAIGPMWSSVSSIGKIPV